MVKKKITAQQRLPKKKTKINKIGILTSGGDAPGLNAVTRAVVKTAVFHYGIKVVGIRDGYEGLLSSKDFTPLDHNEVRGILPRGGTILGTKNTGEFGVLFGEDEKAKEKIVKRGIANLKKNGVDALLTVGGEGSLYMATYFHRAGFPVIGIPKTIDNDLAATDYTFGFDTAVSIATEALDRLTTTAESHDRVMILEVMGRHAGWIALAAGIAGGADIILIPEIPFDAKHVAKHIKLRETTGAGSHIIVVAEGAHPKGKERITYKTPKGQSRLGGIGAWLSEELGDLIDNEIRGTVLGHIQRGGTPSAFDRILATRFGAYAVHMAVEGRSSEMVCLKTPDIGSVPIEEAIRDYHMVDPNSGLIRTGRSIGISFGD